MPTLSNFESVTYTQWAGFLGDVVMFADAEGTIRLGEAGKKSFAVHDGILCASLSRDGGSLVTSGEDGKICRTKGDGGVEIVCEDCANWTGSKWIDKIATGPQGAIAFGCGRKGAVILARDKVQSFEVERSIEGLAFAPKGMRLAIARYDGVELLWINANGAKQFLEWKGAHTGVMFSPDGKYVVSTMQGKRPAWLAAG